MTVLIFIIPPPPILSALIYYNVVTAPLPSGQRKLCLPHATLCPPLVALCLPRDASTSGLRHPSGGIMQPSGWHNVSFGRHNFHCPSWRGAVILHYMLVYSWRIGVAEKWAFDRFLALLIDLKRCWGLFFSNCYILNLIHALWFIRNSL